MSVRRGREEASAAIWHWRGDDGAAEARRTRLGGILRGVAGAMIGGGALWLDHPRIAWVAWSLSGILTLLALASPLGAYAAVSRAMSASGRLVGRVVGWVLLTPVYVFFFVPFRILFRRGARDRMTRRIDPDAVSYWETRPEGEQVRSMRRPY